MSKTFQWGFWKSSKNDDQSLSMVQYISKFLFSCAKPDESWNWYHNKKNSESLKSCCWGSYRNKLLIVLLCIHLIPLMCQMKSHAKGMETVGAEAEEFKTITAFLLQIVQRNQILTFSRQHNSLVGFHVRRYSAASQKKFQWNLTSHCSFQNLSVTLQ